MAARRARSGTALLLAGGAALAALGASWWRSRRGEAALTARTRRRLAPRAVHHPAPSAADIHVGPA